MNQTPHRNTSEFQELPLFGEIGVPKHGLDIGVAFKKNGIESFNEIRIETSSPVTLLYDTKPFHKQRSFVEEDYREQMSLLSEEVTSGFAHYRIMLYLF